jgi:hypothetical protein
MGERGVRHAGSRWRTRSTGDVSSSPRFRPLEGRGFTTLGAVAGQCSVAVAGMRTGREARGRRSFGATREAGPECVRRQCERCAGVEA